MILNSAELSFVSQRRRSHPVVIARSDVLLPSIRGAKRAISSQSDRHAAVFTARGDGK